MKYRKTIDAHGSAEAAWTLIGERFGDLSWTSSIAESELLGELGVGASRRCRSASSFGPFPAAVITETLIHFDPASMTFAYEAEQGLPRFIRRATNRWRVEAAGAERCRVYIDASVELAWWAAPLALILPLLLRNDMARFTAELVAAIESPPDCAIDLRATA